MVNEILTATGIKHAHGRFLRLPETTCAVYFDNVEISAADRVTPPTPAGVPRICTHHITVELYEPAPDDPSEAKLEAALDAQGLEWTKEDRYWLPDVQRYQVLYEFSYIIKK